MDDLRSTRKRRNVPQGELAEKVGLSQVSVLNYESGRVIPRPANRAAIERVLGEPVDWVATRFQRPVSLGHAENEGSDEEILRSIWLYVNAAGGGPARRARIDWVRTVTDYFADGT